ncbi:hypothetical protein P1J78_17545 [Psychromarinibacter sp. C21-152]|uniref:Uncharacterized protein n=1 Tax=Psychromarinibacter sediminicola TaxID=3033385 RepID=A0AAE3NUX2_9RHOB|nr:hypothetical protein [Psychromarinibacter sediminicola]MDF0602546.1 hypothetical protein [Psychromarinibacter sediminicola]
MLRLFRSKLFLMLGGLWALDRLTRPRTKAAAFAEGEAVPETGAGQVRNAGPDAMRDGARRSWDQVDEAADESFPASDPAAKY